MKISIISAFVLGGTMLLTAPLAYAGSSMGYHSGSTHSYSTIGETADCPPGTSRSGDGTCLMNRGGSLAMGSAPMTQSFRTYSGYSAQTYAPSASYSYSSTPLGSYQSQSSYVVDPYVTSTMSDAEADLRYGSGSISQTYTDGSNTIVPFTTTSASLTNYRVPGMGANEFLSPTKCPVSVYNPEGAQVLGCYQVSKPAPVRVSVPNYHDVRVVRPIIYVRYPVPTPLPMPMPVCGNAYGQAYGYHHNQWGRRCGW
ncbi:MAG: hypothetical protein EX271_02210 [Acidimicrobiales bacterium]|nr:hypothetical protein [Hyphomonadaceae bacterium]RZV44264.1 MAG: hypothetical protein EX271_02210 [Acidimicrobiales bacterium]